MSRPLPANLANRILIAGLVLLTLSTVLAAGVSGNNWGTAGEGPGRDSSVSTPAPANPQYSWIFARSYSDPAIANGRVFVAGADRTPAYAYDAGIGLSFYALSQSTGQVLWERLLYSAEAHTNQGQKWEMGTPTVVGDNVYFLDWQAKLWALRASDGALLWTQRIGTESHNGRAAPLVVGSVIVNEVDNDASASVNRPELVAVDATTGGQLWRTATDFSGRNLASDGTRVFSSHGVVTRAQSLSNGAFLWEFRPPRGGSISAPVAANGLVYLVNTNQYSGAGNWEARLIALNPATGAIQWEIGYAGGEMVCCSTAPEGDPSAPAVDADLLVFAARGQIHAMNPTIPDARWNYALGGPTQGAPILTSDSVIIARKSLYEPHGEALDGAGLVALDRTSGNTRWSLAGQSDPVGLVDQSSNPAYAQPHIIGGFRHRANYQIPYDNAVFALGTDTIAPVWVGGHALRFENGPNGQRLRWGPVQDLNMARFLVQHSSSGPNGPWTTYTETLWTGTESTSLNLESDGLQAPLQVVVPGTNHYRVIPVDRSNNQGVPNGPIQGTSSGSTMTATPTAGTPTPTSTGAATTAPTSQPPATPTTGPPPVTPSQAYGNPSLQDCNSPPVRSNTGYIPFIESPTGGGRFSVTQAILGQTKRYGGDVAASDIETRVWARLGNQDYRLGVHRGEGSWRFNFETSQYPDGEYRLWAEAVGGGQRQFSNVACMQVDNGKDAYFELFSNWADPDPAPTSAENGFRVWLKGESTKPIDVADVIHVIDGNRLAQTQVQVQSASSPNSRGHYDFLLADWYHASPRLAQGEHHYRVVVDVRSAGTPFYHVEGGDVAFQVSNAAMPSLSAVPTGTATASYTTTAPGPEFRVEPGGIALDASLPTQGQLVTVYARVVNSGAGGAAGRVALAIIAPNGAVEFAARLPVSLAARDETLVSTNWMPAYSGRYSVHAALENDDTLSAADAARVAAQSTSRTFDVGQSPTDRPVLLLTAGLLNIGAIDEGTSRTVAVEVTAYGQDAHGVRLDVFEDSELDVTSLTPPTTIPAGQTIKFFVRIRVPELADNATLEDHRIIVRAANDASSSNIESMDLVAHPVEFQGVPLFGPAATIAALAVAGSATAFFRRRQ